MGQGRVLIRFWITPGWRLQKPTLVICPRILRPTLIALSSVDGSCKARLF
jgi:hypothetical protein